MICSKCNKEIDANSRVCPYCGNQIIISNDGQNNGTNSTNKVNIGLAILSFIIPLAGLIIFIVKKEKNPKTAKACGICALVGCFINLLIIGFTFKLFNFGVDFINQNSNSTIDTIRKTEESNSTGDINELKDLKKGNVSLNWKDYEVSINDYVLSLPCTYKQLETVTELDMKSYQKESKIPSNYYMSVNLYKNNKLALYIEIINDTNAEANIINGKVTRIWQSKYQLENGADVVCFPGNIKVGTQITEQELIKMFGEPNKKSDYSSDGYNKVVYQYVNDINWTTTNYFEISIVSGVIDEIILDHRNY